MLQRKLKRRIDQADLMRRTDRLDLRYILQHPVRCRVIVVKRPRFGPGRQHTGVIGAADHHAHAAQNAERQETVERRLLQQGIAPRQQENVEIAAFDQPLGRLPFVDARAKGPDHPLIAQRHQSAVAARHELFQPGLHRLGAAVGEDVEVMGKENVDPVQPGPLQRKGDRAHHAIIGVIKNLDPVRHFKPLADAIADLALPRRPQHPPDFGGDDKPRPPTQNPVEPGFGLTKTIERRRVEIAHPQIPGAGHRGMGVRVADRAVKAANRCRAKPQFGKFQSAFAQPVPNPCLQLQVLPSDG